MTIGGWVIYVVAVVSICALAGLFFIEVDSVSAKILIIMITILVLVGLLFGMLWYFNNTATGQRALTDQRSDLNNGLNRTVTIYTANGDVIAQYTGKIDIDTNDGGYVKFDFEGKRYIYYNCFVETIADIG